MVAEPSKYLTDGYYRYTDIMFEWWKSVPDDSVEQLKAILYPKCITDPQHPLANEDGALELTRGVMKSTSEVRMLFGYGQIEYLRNWMYDIGLTPQRIPLPASEYLVLPEMLRPGITKETYKSDTELKKAQKDLVKSNKRLKGVGGDIQDLRDSFEHLRKIFQSKDRDITWCAIDFERWDGSSFFGRPSVISEFGFSMVKQTAGVTTREQGHYIQKNAPRNGEYTPDCRDHYCFGKSLHFTKSEFKTRVQQFMDGLLHSKAPLFLVFHAPKSDVEDLKTLGTPVDGMVYKPPEEFPSSGLFCVDTQKVFRALEGHKDDKKLVKVHRILGLGEAEFAHNAGNDAHYTMRCFESMMSGSSIDIQRTERWPVGDIPPNVKREYARPPRPEDDSDYEDPSRPF